VCASGVSQAQNLIQNGSFESPDVIGHLWYGVGNGIPGWTIVSTTTNVVVIDNFDTAGGVLWHDTPVGDQVLYIGNSVGVSVVEQSVALESGDVGSLSFLQADFASLLSVGSPGGKVIVSLRDSLGNFLIGPTTFTTPDLSGYIERELDFLVPVTDSYTLSLESIQGHAGLVDDVRIEIVPEPATMAALGLGAAALIRRRRR